MSIFALSIMTIGVFGYGPQGDFVTANSCSENSSEHKINMKLTVLELMQYVARSNNYVFPPAALKYTAPNVLKEMLPHVPNCTSDSMWGSLGCICMLMAAQNLIPKEINERTINSLCIDTVMRLMAIIGDDKGACVDNVKYFLKADDGAEPLNTDLFKRIYGRHQLFNQYFAQMTVSKNKDSVKGNLGEKIRALEKQDFDDYGSAFWGIQGETVRIGQEFMKDLLAISQGYLAAIEENLKSEIKPRSKSRQEFESRHKLWGFWLETLQTIRTYFEVPIRAYLSNGLHNILTDPEQYEAFLTGFRNGFNNYKTNEKYGPALNPVVKVGENVYEMVQQLKKQKVPFRILMRAWNEFPLTSIFKKVTADELSLWIAMLSTWNDMKAVYDHEMEIISEAIENKDLDKLATAHNESVTMLKAVEDQIRIIESS